MGPTANHARVGRGPSAPSNLLGTVRGVPGQHLVLRGDSRHVRYAPTFDLVITSPPFFHPSKRSQAHGRSMGDGNLGAYVTEVARVLSIASEGLRPTGVLCFIKTDVWHGTRLFPVGSSIAAALEEVGLRLRAQWIWERHVFFTPYSPSVANIFILSAGRFERPRFAGVIRDAPIRRSHGRPTTFVPELFAKLIDLLAPPGGLVLDPFAGGGSVIEGAAQTGRWSVGVELSARQLSQSRGLLSTRANVTFSDLATLTRQSRTRAPSASKGWTA